MKRHLIVFLLLIVAGAILNVAVAWGCAVRAYSDRSDRRLVLGETLDGDGYAAWHVNAVIMFGTTHVLSEASVGPNNW